VARAHPLLHVNDVEDLAALLGDLFGDLLVRLRLFSALQVTSEVLQKCNFLLQILRVVLKGVFFAHILTVGTAALHVVEMEAVWVKYYFGGVIEEHACRLIAQVVA